MPLTNAQKQKDTRARRKAKLQRLAAYEAALREIAEHPGPGADDTCWRRVYIARQVLAADRDCCEASNIAAAALEK